MKPRAVVKRGGGPERSGRGGGAGHPSVQGRRRVDRGAIYVCDLHAAPRVDGLRAGGEVAVKSSAQ